MSSLRVEKLLSPSPELLDGTHESANGVVVSLGPCFTRRLNQASELFVALESQVMSRRVLLARQIRGEAGVHVLSASLLLGKLCRCLTILVGNLGPLHATLGKVVEACAKVELLQRTRLEDELCRIEWHGLLLRPRRGLSLGCVLLAIDHVPDGLRITHDSLLGLLVPTALVGGLSNHRLELLIAHLLIAAKDGVIVLGEEVDGIIAEA